MGFLKNAISSFASSNPIGAAISGGVSLLGGLFGNKSQSQNIDKQIAAQKEENQKNREYNLMLAQHQNQWNQEQWERENDYNTPEAQMERLKKAGLNPDLAYGGPNLSASSPMMTSGAPSNPTDMTALGQKPTVGQAVQTALRDSLIGAQIKNIEADTKKKLNESDILASDASFRDALNQGTLNLQNTQILINNSELKLNNQQTEVLRNECIKLEQESKNLVAEYDKIRASIANIDSDTASKLLHDALDSAKVEAEIRKLSSSTGLDYANTKRIVTLLSAELAGIQANTASTWADVSIKGAEQVQIEATTDGIRFDLSQAKDWSQIERGTGVYGKIMQGLTPIANIIGLILGSGIVKGKPNPIGFRR